MLEQVLNMGEKPIPLDLLKQVAYVEHIASSETGARQEGPSSGCSELHKRVPD